MFKAFRVDFKYTVEETASMYVVAENADAAAAGCKQMLGETEQYVDPEIVLVEEFKKPEDNTTTATLQ